MTACKLAISTVLFVVASQSALAGDADTNGAHILSMGNAGTAHPSDNNAITVNPGALGLTRRYDVGAHFRFGPTSDLGWSGSIIDSQTNDLVAFGITYDGSMAAPPFRSDELPGWTPAGTEPVNLKTRHIITGAVGFALWERRIGLGLSGTVALYDTAQYGPGTTGNIDIGFGFAPIEAFSFGMVGKNILPIPNQSDTPAAFRVGVRSAVAPWFAAAADFEWQTEEVNGAPYTVGVGVEGGVASVRARGGYLFDGTFATHNVTWGLGLQNEAGSIDFGMQIPIGPETNAASLLNIISVRIHAAQIKDMLDGTDEAMGYR